MYDLHLGVFFGMWTQLHNYMFKLICTCVNIHLRVNIHLLRPDVKLLSQYMYFWSCEHAANIHTYANLCFPLISSKICSKNNIFLCQIEKYFFHSLFRTNMALRIKFHTHYVFTKVLIFSYNNAQIHPNVTVQYLKSIPFVQKAWKNVRSYFGCRQKSVVFLN